MNKVIKTATEPLRDVGDGAVILIGGFGTAGVPDELIEGLLDNGCRDLTIVNNNAGNGDRGVAALLKSGRVRKVICSFPRQADSWVFDELYRNRRLELELVPQGTLAERIRAAGAGVPAFFTPTAYGTPLAEGKESRMVDGKHCVLEYALHGDFALIKAEHADAWGNLVYRKAARNFGPIMAMAARTTVASVFDIVPAGAVDPEVVVTPGVFVHRLIQVDRVATAAGGFHGARAA